MPEFVPLAERIVDAILETDPAMASFAGDHRFDDRLPDLSPGAVADRVAMLRDAADTLAGIDPDAFGEQDRVDHAILSAVVERGMFELGDIREHEWNPLEHNPGPLLHALLSRPFAPVEERLSSLGGRLAAIPDALATARAVLRDVPRLHTEVAIGQFAGTAALIRGELPGMLAGAPSLRGAIEPAAAAALDALGEFDLWLKARPGERRSRPRPAAGLSRCGRPGSGTRSTPSCRPPRSWPGPSAISTRPASGSARPRPSWSAARRPTRRCAGRWTPSPSGTPTTRRSSTWPR
nr:hypothetical protein GCM10020092_097860 [Actinoplanes digitatis]